MCLLRLPISVFGHNLLVAPVKSCSAGQSERGSCVSDQCVQADPKAQARILDSYGKLPLSFEANHGQADARVKFLSRTGGYSLFLTGDEAVFALSGSKANTHKAKIAGTGHTLAIRHGCAQSRWRAADEAPQCESCGQGNWRG